MSNPTTPAEEVRPLPPRTFAQAKRFAERLEEMHAFIEAYIEEHKYPPSIREMMQSLGISSQSVVHYRIVELERRGIVALTPGIARGIRLLKPSPRKTKKRASAP